jgi:hypothetical protein
MVVPDGGTVVTDGSVEWLYHPLIKWNGCTGWLSGRLYHMIEVQWFYLMVVPKLVGQNVSQPSRGLLENSISFSNACQTDISHYCTIKSLNFAFMEILSLNFMPLGFGD